jgi:hypothetical protein
VASSTAIGILIEEFEKLSQEPLISRCRDWFSMQMRQCMIDVGARVSREEDGDTVVARAVRHDQAVISMLAIRDVTWCAMKRPGRLHRPHVGNE